MRLKTNSAERMSWNVNQKPPFLMPSVAWSHCRKPWARVVLPTPPSPWINSPAGLRCMARSSASTAPSRPMKP